jgi:hypothetical protein
MTNKEIREKLEEAQRLLSDVYNWACNSRNKSLESQMSCADSCIIEALDELED